LAGQGTYALSGLAVQIAAARELGAAGLAAFSLGYGALVLGTAVSSGLVGDSLTILDRREPRIRAGLLAWTALVCLAVSAAGVLAATWSHVLPLWAAPVLGLACAAFIVEDTLRRLLEAIGRFWSLPVVDMTSLVLALGTLAVGSLTGRITMTTFVLAVLVGQAGAAVVAWWCLPADERPRGPWRSPALGVVGSFGVWPAVTQTIRPASFTLLRIVLIALVGAAAYGPVEIARVYTAPTLLVVTGVGSFLLPHFVAMRDRGLAAGLRLADRTVAVLAVGASGMGALGLVLLPWLGGLMTGGAYPVPVGAAVAWTGYGLAAAALLPYSRLALVHGGQRRVLALRTWELGSLTLAALLVLWIPGAEVWTPLALALGPALAAVVLRQSLLVPMIRRAAASTDLEPARA
jgi:O-antigen/teichoic acid export membrane protein